MKRSGNGAQELRVDPGWQSAGKWEPQSCNRKELNSISNLKGLGRGSWVPDENTANQCVDFSLVRYWAENPSPPSLQQCELTSGCGFTPPRSWWFALQQQKTNTGFCWTVWKTALQGLRLETGRPWGGYADVGWMPRITVRPSLLSWAHRCCLWTWFCKTPSNLGGGYFPQTGCLPQLLHLPANTGYSVPTSFLSVPFWVVKISHTSYQ